MLARALAKKVPQFNDALADYALSLKASHAITSPDFVVTPAMRAEFLRRLASRGVTLDAATLAVAGENLDRRIGISIASYVFGELAGFQRGVRGDPMIAHTLELVRGATTQEALLARAKSAASKR